MRLPDHDSPLPYRMNATDVYRLTDLGFTVFPLRPRSKKPPAGIAWKSFQDAPPSHTQLAAWLDRYPDTNWAIITGRPSSIVVFDADGPIGEAHIRRLGGSAAMSTAMVRTARGVQFYFAHPGGHVMNFAGKLFEVDFRGDGGYVVAPGSIHPSGRQYQWMREVSWPSLRAWLNRIERSDILPVPEGLARLLVRQDGTMTERGPIWISSRYADAALRGEVAAVRSTREGQRNHRLNRAAFSLGQLVAEGQMSEAAVVEALLGAAHSIGLSVEEARTTIQSGLKAGLEKPRHRRAHGQEK